MSALAENLTPAFTVEENSKDDREAWLESRRSSVGASEIATVLGCGFLGILELYYLKTGELEREDDSNELMRLGLRLERGIADEVIERAGVTEDLALRGRKLRSIEHPWATATPDGLTLAGEPIEVKNLTFGYDAEEYAEGIPEKYYLQCQFQMMVTGATRCLFGCLIWGNRIVWEWVERDEPIVQKMLTAGAEFWNRVQRRDPPPSDGHERSRKALSKMACGSAANDDEIEIFEAGDLLDEFERTESILDQRKADLKSAQAKHDAVKDELAQLLDGHRSGFTSSGWTIRWKTSERREYTVKATTVTRLEIKPPKED